MNIPNRRIRVLNVVGAMNRAGQETFLMNVFKHVDKRKFDFSFLYNDRSLICDFDNEIRTLGGTIVYPPDDVKRLRLLRYLKKHKDNIDILYIPTNNAFTALYSVISGRMSGIRHIVVHSHSSNSSKRLLNYVCRPVLRHLNVRRYACSRVAGEWVFGSHAKDVRVVTNGICQEDFVVSEDTRRQVRDSFGIGPNQLALVHVGRFIEVKNHRFLLDVFRRLKCMLPEAVLVLVGDGELKDTIVNAVDALDLNDSVVFTGVRSDIPELLMGMDVFVLPSLYEGLPVTAIEAQASGMKCFLSACVTSEAKVVDNVLFLPLGNNAELWAKTISNESNYERKDVSEQIKIKGYDIRETAKWIENDYCSLLDMQSG